MDFLDKYEKQLKKLAKVELTAGVFKEATNSDGDSIVDYAIKNEFGEGNVPARSFIASTVDEKEQYWNSIIEKIYNKFSQDNNFNVEQNIEKLGEVLINDIKEKILSNIPPPNAKSTIKRKGSDRTLIHTSALLQSIEYKIKNV